VPKPKVIELNDGSTIPILFENRSVLAIDKPAGWMLVPFTWQKTNRNLHAAIVASIASGKFWATSRGLRYLCHIHRLDTDTTGILLLAKSRGALDTIGDLFEERRVAKRYLAVVDGVPPRPTWISRCKLAQDEDRIGRVKVDPKGGKDAETHFLLLGSKDGRSLVEARPVTGRTHQIRVHLANDGWPVQGDLLYGRPVRRPVPATSREAASGDRETRRGPKPPLALRAIDLGYTDPFTHTKVAIHAPFEPFVRAHGFDPGVVPEFLPRG